VFCVLLPYLNQTMSALSIPFKFYFPPTTATSFPPSQTKPLNFTFQRRTRTPTKTACAASENPKQRQNPKKNRTEAKTETTSDDVEKGIDPAGFLAKRGISHKAFALFLRERHEIWKI